MKIKLIQTIYASELKSRAVLVMNYLIFRANQEGTCFPAIKTIARECHIGINTVKRALDDLVEAGYVKKETRFMQAKNGAQTSNLYTLSGGMFVTEEIDAPETETLDESAPVRCPEENDPIEHETFEQQATSALSVGPLSSSSPVSKPGSAPTPCKKYRPIPNGTAGLFFHAFSGWAGGQPMRIPP